MGERRSAGSGVHGAAHRRLRERGSEGDHRAAGDHTAGHACHAHRRQCAAGGYAGTGQDEIGQHDREGL